MGKEDTYARYLANKEYTQMERLGENYWEIALNVSPEAEELTYLAEITGYIEPVEGTEFYQFSLPIIAYAVRRHITRGLNRLLRTRTLERMRFEANAKGIKAQASKTTVIPHHKCWENEPPPDLSHLDPNLRETIVLKTTNKRKILLAGAQA